MPRGDPFIYFAAGGEGYQLSSRTSTGSPLSALPPYAARADGDGLTEFFRKGLPGRRLLFYEACEE
jgi:hypothetical protein